MMLESKGIIKRIRFLWEKYIDEQKIHLGKEICVMKCKVVILEQDQNYQNRLLVALREKFQGIVEVIPCHNQSEILTMIETHQPDLFVINERIDFDLAEIPEECATACFTEFRTADKVKDKPAICKYQKVKDISSQLIEIAEDYKEVLKVKREEEKKAEEERLERERKAEEERLERERQAEEERLERERQQEEERKLREQQEREEEERRKEEERIRLEEEQKAEAERIAARRRNPEVLVFLSAQEGNGSATAAAACALNAAERGLHILCIHIRPLKSTGDIFTKSDADITISEFIGLANREELTVEHLAQAVSTDESGVDSIGSGDEAIVMAELEKKGFLQLLSRIGEAVQYDAVVLNIDFSLNSVILEALKSAAKIVIVGNGFAESNARIEAYIGALKKYDERNETSVSDNISILYNKFINRKCTMLSIPGVDVIGGANNLDGSNSRAVSVNMAKMMVFKQLISD